MSGTEVGGVGLVVLLGWSGLMFGLGEGLRRSGWPGPPLPDDELPWQAVVSLVAGTLVLVWTAELRVFGLPAPLLTSAPLVVVYSALLVDAGWRRAPSAGRTGARADGGESGMAPAQKTALVQQAWVSRQRADETQTRAKALASKVAELRARNAPLWTFIDAVEDAAQAFDEATWVAQEADKAAWAVRDAVGCEGRSGAERDRRAPSRSGPDTDRRHA